MVLIQTTMLKPLENNLIGSAEREKVLCTFSKLNEIHTIKGPKFIFAHILVPHPPFIFGANGEPITESKLEMNGYVWKQKEGYLNQLIFVNKKIKMFVNETLSKSERPPIIVIQADHGSASTFEYPDNGKWAWGNITEKMLRERMGIFNAYYLPNNGNSNTSNRLYESITPVNSFRLIFNLYFNTSSHFPHPLDLICC